jgi:hypothetical protein
VLGTSSADDAGVEFVHSHAAASGESGADDSGGESSGEAAVDAVVRGSGTETSEEEEEEEAPGDVDPYRGSPYHHRAYSSGHTPDAAEGSDAGEADDTEGDADGEYESAHSSPHDSGQESGSELASDEEAAHDSGDSDSVLSADSFGPTLERPATPPALRRGPAAAALGEPAVAPLSPAPAPHVPPTPVAPAARPGPPTPLSPLSDAGVAWSPAVVRSGPGTQAARLPALRPGASPHGYGSGDEDSVQFASPVGPGSAGRRVSGSVRRALVAPESPAARSSPAAAAAAATPASPASLPAADTTEGENDSEVSLLYDPVLDCYFDPVSHKYYTLR